MTNTKTRLLRLVAQLTAPGLEGEMIRQRFNRLPLNVMDDFDLEPEARKALLSMTFDKIGDYIKSELQLWAWPPGEFPEPDPKCYIPPPGPTLPPAQYAMPNPQFKAVRPTTGPVGGMGYDFTLYGEGLLLPLKVSLVPAGGGAPVDYDSSNAQIQAEGTFRCARIKVTGDLPTATGIYDVKVYDLLGPKATDVFEVPSVGVQFEVTP